MDVFAADLWEVFKDRGVDEYKDQELFFQKTYQTEGLKHLSTIVEKRLQGQGGDPVTPFGGGKTHALIALYHQAEEWQAKRVVKNSVLLKLSGDFWKNNSPAGSNDAKTLLRRTEKCCARF